MSKIKKIALITSMILTPLLGALSGGYVGVRIGMNNIRSTEDWQSLGMPENKPIQLLGFCEGTICVETQDGRRYRYNSNNCSSPETKACWSEVVSTEIEPVIPHIYNPCLYENRIPSPPPDTIQILGAKICGSGGDWYAYHALLEDGSVWKWEQSISDMAPLGILSLAIWGIVIGLVVGVLTLAVLAYSLQRGATKRKVVN